MYLEFTVAIVGLLFAIFRISRVRKLEKIEFDEVSSIVKANSSLKLLGINKEKIQLGLINESNTFIMVKNVKTYIREDNEWQEFDLGWNVVFGDPEKNEHIKKEMNISNIKDFKIINIEKPVLRDKLYRVIVKTTVGTYKIEENFKLQENKQ